MTELQIIGIRIPDGVYKTHDAITRYQWKDSSGASEIWTKEQLIEWMLADEKGRAVYVIDPKGTKTYCRVMKSAHATTFLQVDPQSDDMNILLHLPQV